MVAGVKSRAESRYVALDRDGTILNYVPYLRRKQDVSLIASAGDAIAHLNRAGFKIVVVTNQSVVGRGMLEVEDMVSIHDEMLARLSECNAHLDAILVCPHAPRERCNCRKPMPHLLTDYLLREGIQPDAGFVIGDNLTDIGLALNVGAIPIHVQTGIHTKSEVAAKYDHVPSVRNLGAAALMILGETDGF